MFFFKKNKKLFIIFIIPFLTLSLYAKKIDPATMLVVDKGLDVVVENCLTCHTANLIIEKQRSRKDWLKLIRWMQANVGLWQLDKKTENTILDYLERNYSHVKSKKPLVPNLNLNNIK